MRMKDPKDSRDRGLSKMSCWDILGLLVGVKFSLSGLNTGKG